MNTDNKIAEITEKAIRRVSDCRYEDDKIHIHIHHAIQEARVLFQDQLKECREEIDRLVVINGTLTREWDNNVEDYIQRTKDDCKDRILENCDSIREYGPRGEWIEYYMWSDIEQAIDSAEVT